MAGLPDFRGRDASTLAEIFRYFARVETTRLDAHLYETFSEGIADDPALLALCGEIPGRQPAPNVLYAAVQDLLLEDPDASPEARALARFYPAVSGAPIPDESPWQAFRSFCLAHREALLPRLQTGRTQTCVVHRCAVVLPALAVLPRIAEAGGRVALLEIGPSAGLNLRLDRYRYDYGDGRVWGAPDARPVLECETRGATPPPLPGALDVVARRGLDLDPIDLGDPAAVRWLRALVWPEHAWRARVMDEALARAATTPVEIEAGDATREIGRHIERLPRDAARVVFATHVLYQSPAEGRRRLRGAIARASRDQPVDFISMESTGHGDSHLHWLGFEDGERRRLERLALADSHGRWIAWGAT
jgi:hypothetical protein